MLLFLNVNLLVLLYKYSYFIGVRLKEKYFCIIPLVDESCAIVYCPTDNKFNQIIIQLENYIK